MPPDVSFVDAASLPVAYGTAHRMMITHETVKAGDRVLVLGASGGVGTGCVMLAKHLGAEVIACAGSDDKMQRLKELGRRSGRQLPRDRLLQVGDPAPTASRSGAATRAVSTSW